jgi:acetylornithine deacetylase/succinyl-diaminopimelate desuccinylase-like protein
MEGQERVYGLGATSTKGSISLILEALEVLINSSEVVPSMTFLGVSRAFHPNAHGLEDAFRMHTLDAECAIVLEPTNLQVGIGARGLSHIEVTFTGKPHHAGRPDHHLNPIVGAAEFVHKALRQPLLDHPQLGSASLTAVEWRSEGQRPHTPGSATVLVDRRLLPDDPPMEPLLDQLKHMASEFSEYLDVEFSINLHQYPWAVDHDEKIVACLSESLRVVLGKEPVLYTLPFSTAAGNIKKVAGIPPVAFSGGDIASLGLQEHAVLSKNLMATQAIVGALILYAESSKI